MRTIKTRARVKNIKALDKTLSLSARMKNTLARTKERAEETQNTLSATPTDYATGRVYAAVRNTAEGAAREGIHVLRNPRQKARQSLERAGDHFREVKRNMPKERKRAAEYAQKNAQKAKSGTESLRKTADQTKETAGKAKAAVNDAKRTLKEVRRVGRLKIRGVKQTVKAERSGVSRGEPISAPEIAPKGKPPANPEIGVSGNAPVTAARRGPVRSGYTGVTPKGGAMPAETIDTAAKSVKSARKGFKETAKGTVKTARKSAKTAGKSAKAAVKTAKQTAKTAQKTAQAAAKAAKTAERAARTAAKAAVHTAKAATKAITATVKAAVAAVKGLAALIAAGGWIAVTVILIICMIGLLTDSVFGIFFSGGDSGNGCTMPEAVAEINTEYADKISEIRVNNPHDDIALTGTRALWKDVLAVYAVRTVTDTDNAQNVATMDDSKKVILQGIFWDMNAVSYRTDNVTVTETAVTDDGAGNLVETGETVTKTVLYISVSGKTAAETADEYGFTAGQKAQLAELLSDEYADLWAAALYGIHSGSADIVAVAVSQIGNVGGGPYWSWYGFSSRAEWCACFVSWCANEAGYIDVGILPRFAACQSQGVPWFGERGLWREPGYIPAPGDIVFFDWGGDGSSDHVGIVEYAEGEYVHTVEGNTGDSCARRSYRIDSVKIQGYGVPIYG
jgi:cell wall-associated NlpC family hydrolase